MKIKKCLILLSTYNGEKYLQELLDSVYAQENVIIDVLIRDDGSTDNTIKIIEKYRKRKNNLKWYSGENLKPAKSFIDLIFKASCDYDYYAFCDQDDVWNPQKIENAINKLEKVDKNEPALYNCSLQVVDSKLYKIGEIFHENFINESIFDLITLGIPGCSYVFNKKLLSIAQKHKPEKVCMHDAWIAYLNYAVGGCFISDKQCGILYRQHSTNTIGATKRNIYRGIKDIFCNNDINKSDTIKEILLLYGDEINNERKNKMKVIAEYRTSLKCKLKLLLTRYNGNGYSRKSFIKNKLCILFNSF